MVVNEVAGRGLAHNIRGLPAGRPCWPIQHLWEAPVFTERTSVGLDVHARSVAAAAIDAVTGELVRAKLTPSHEHIRSWLGGLPGPVAVAYEAGPTGFGLCRALRANGIRCEVIAASKVARPAGPLLDELPADDPSPLAEMSPEEETAADYSAMQMTTGPHLMEHWRGKLDAQGLARRRLDAHRPRSGRQARRNREDVAALRRVEAVLRGAKA